MGHRLLEVLIPAVISALLLREGVQGKRSKYSLNVSSPVTVQQGLRAIIPCRYTYDPAHDDPRAELYGYWYVENHPRRPSLVATNNPKRTNDIEPHIRRRFEVLGSDLSRGYCSLTIKDVEAADQATYHFRMEKGRKARYSYSALEEKVSVIVTATTPKPITETPTPTGSIKPATTPEPVTETPTPTGSSRPDLKLVVTIPELLRAGIEARITCIAPRHSSLDPPTITWRGFSEASGFEIISRPRRSTVDSIVDFTPGVADHLRNVTCKATYARGSRPMTVERTVTLSVNHPPRKFQFSGFLKRPSGEVQNFTDISQITPRKGDSLVVHCEADGHPPSNAVWRLRFPATRLVIFNNKLTLSNIEPEDKGQYICGASNTEGYFQDSFSLQIHHE